MKSNLFTMLAFAAILAFAGWASHTLGADAPASEQQELAVLQAQVTHLQERVERLESQVAELSKPKLRPAEGR